MKSFLVLSVSPSACFAFVPSPRLNRVASLSLCARSLCLLCRYPLAPSHFDKPGRENKPPRCQTNAKHGASFLRQWLFNQLPLISAFSECNGGGICTPPTSSPLNTPLHLFICLLLRFLASPSNSVILLASLLILCHAGSLCLISLFFPSSWIPPSCLPVSHPYLPSVGLSFSLHLCNIVPLLIKHRQLCCSAARDSFHKMGRVNKR